MPFPGLHLGSLNPGLSATSLCFLSALWECDSLHLPPLLLSIRHAGFSARRWFSWS